MARLETLPVCGEVAAISVDVLLTEAEMAVKSVSGTMNISILLSEQASAVPAAFSEKHNNKIRCEHWLDRWLPGVIKDLLKERYPADLDVYRKIEATCLLSIEEIKLTHLELAIKDLVPSRGILRIEELRRFYESENDRSCFDASGDAGDRAECL